MKNILVAESDREIRKEICSHLDSYKTYQAGTCRTALETARTLKPDLILLDILMPDMDGFYFMDQLQQHPRLEHIPVIFISSDISPEFQVKGLKSGVVDFILMQPGCPPDKILDWDILKFRVGLHLQLGEYRLSLEHSLCELENNIGLSFAELIECKDYNFSGHVMRTERYAEFLALALYNDNSFPESISLNYIEEIRQAVPYHDIGKIGISEEILCKRGPLNDKELKIAQSHTTIGAKMLNNISRRIPEKSYFNLAGIIARGHHERFDGKGYPDGFSGEDIPLACRIVSVVNVYDACTNERVYHPAMSHESAIREIEKAGGGEFDPRIVKVFLDHKDEFGRLGKEMKGLLNQLDKLPFLVSKETEAINSMEIPV